MINLEASVEGEPEPEITWYDPNGSELRQGGRVKVEQESYHSKLQIRGTERSNSGVYTVKATNVNGQDTVTVKVNVIDKPGPPEG